MLKTLALTLLITGSGLALAAQDASSIPRIATELTVLPAAMVPARDRVAILGNNVVVTKAVAAKYVMPQKITEAELLVVEDISHGQFGTTNGGIVVHLHAKDRLHDLAADYGLRVHHEFGALPMGVLLPAERESAGTVVMTLRADERVISAILDVNFYQEQAR